MKIDSLTVLDYIKTSIEILMQMKLEDEKGSKKDSDESKKKRLKSSSTREIASP